MKGALGLWSLSVLCGCAGPLSVVPAGDRPVADSEQGWGALTEGRTGDAAAAFDRRLSVESGDLVARFGRATVAFERGDSGRALEDYAAVVSAAAEGKAAPGGDVFTALLATVAAGRVLGLGEEVAEAQRRAVEDRLLAAPRHRLPWMAQLELARLGDRTARRRHDRALVERTAAAAGCVTGVYRAGSAGPLAHLDLERETTKVSVPASWQPVIGVGCRLSVPSWESRSGVQVLRIALRVPGRAEDPALRYQIVVDHGGQAAWRLDGGGFQRHGSGEAYGPRAAAARVVLGPGRHDLEVRLAAVGSSTELSLLVLPEAPGSPVAFVDPRPSAGADARAGVQPVVVEMLPAVGPAPALAASGALAALFEYAAAHVADRSGEINQALTRAARLAAYPRFVSGLTLAAAIERNDVTRPGGFARDGARALLRRAVGVDPSLARAWQTLAAIELEDERHREALGDARQAAAAAPSWWAPELMLAGALRARGLEWDAERALDRAATKVGTVPGAPCALIDALLRRAEERRDLPGEEALFAELGRCEPESDALAHRRRLRGDLPGALAILQRMAALAPERDDLGTDVAALMLATGQGRQALAALQQLVARAPRDMGARLRLADAEVAAGDLAAARKVIREGLDRRPDVQELRRAARALEIPLPLDEHRVDGSAVIRAYNKGAAPANNAPAVVVLDRTVTRVFPDGASMTLTHNIVQVLTKEAIDRWGEVSVGAGAEILLLRTHKPDGSTRQPEEVAGKETISAADLAIGDFIEWETLETKLPPDAFPGGYLGDRFYFRSFDAPLERSEFVLITPSSLPLDVDRRAGAPQAQRSAGAGDTVITRFAAANVPQLFAERASVPAIEYVPSVRASSGVTWQGWSRFVSEQLHGTSRSSPAIQKLAASIKVAAQAGPADRARLAAAVVAWVTANIEAAEDLRDPASFTLARGRGNRLALALALARELDLPARAVLVRSRLTADGDGRGAPRPHDLDDFADTLVRFDLGTPTKPRAVYADLRLRHASFGYLPPTLDGALTLALGAGGFERATSTGSLDGRTIDMTIRLHEDGGGTARATEELTGWPALEWAELMDRFGSDRAKLQQDFEQRWLGVHFPGARLEELKVELPEEMPPVPAAPAAPAATTASGAAATTTPSRPGPVRVRYSFASPRLGVLSAPDTNARELKVSPTFFRSQPGRRFAAEPQRSTTLMLGFDVPFRLTATVELPRAATMLEPVAPPAGVVARKGGYRFVEERFLRRGTPDVLVLRRESALPIMRVSPEEYAGVAADLRRVDGLEQHEIRIHLGARPAGPGAVGPGGRR